MADMFRMWWPEFARLEAAFDRCVAFFENSVLELIDSELRTMLLMSWQCAILT
jgi:hypothetical protein